jgi:hypothetical protein
MIGKVVGIGEVEGSGVGALHVSSSVAEHARAEALHAVAPQHAKGVGAVQAEHIEVPLRSAGPEQP